MDRRGFLKALAGTAAALGYAAIAPDTISALTSPSASPVAIEQATRKTLEWITRHVARNISNRLGPMTLVESSDINAETSRIHGVSLDLIGESMTDDEYEERYVMPMAVALAEAMKDNRARVCGTLPLPNWTEYGCVVTYHGLSLRGLQFYDVMTDSHQLRFDVLYG